MYCIISLPRTASTFAWSLINNSLILKDARYAKFSMEHCEPFNPKYAYTKEQQHQVYENSINSNPIPVVKILTNHTYDVVTWFTKEPYQLVFIKPMDVRKQILSSLIMSTSKNLFGTRLERKEQKGTLRFSKQDIEQRIAEYRNHMRLEISCKYSFYNTQIIDTPEYFLETIGLPITKITYRHIPPIISDEDMLADIDEFNKLYNECEEWQYT